MKKILFVMGTRPEVIKMAPVIHELKKQSIHHVRIISTAQHRHMLDQMLTIFSLKPDRDLDIMKKNQTLPELTSRLPLPLDKTLEEENPDLVLAQGDTTTVFMVALACFYRKIPFGHVEAGLRTHDLYTPFPEEMNRILISRLTTLNFSPTEKAKQNLLDEGFQENQIFVTGNTVIDALHAILEKKIDLDPRIQPDKKLVLVTAHRRENFGDNLAKICQALETIIKQNPGVQVLYPIHPNPNVSHTVHRYLGTLPQAILSEPLPYDVFVTAMKQAYLILSDSGGVQEEAPALGTPVLVLREQTERPEAVAIGAARLVGADPQAITSLTQQLLENEDSYRKMIVQESPFGDGKAAKRIATIIDNYFC